MTHTLEHESTLSHTFTASPAGATRPGGRLLVGLAAALALVLSLAQMGFFSRALVNPGGWPIAWAFIRAALTPTLTPEFARLALDATLTTLAYAVAGASLSLVIGFVGGILSSEVWWSSLGPRRYTAPWLAVRAAFAVPRAIHEIIWGLFFINIFGLDPLTAILAIALPFGAITAKVFSELLDETPRAPLAALLAAGAPPLSAFAYSLLPQAFPNLLAYAFYRFECAIRSAALLGIIGAGGLGFQLLLSFQALRYGDMWTFIYALILLNGIIDLWSSLLRRRLGGANRIDLNARRLSTVPSTPIGPDTIVRLSAILALALIPLSFLYVGPDVGKLIAPRTLTLLSAVLGDSFPPTLAPVTPAMMLALTAQTLAVSIVAIAVAGLGGVLLSFPAAANIALPGGVLDVGGAGLARRLMGGASLVALRLLLLALRAVPPPVWALILLFVLFPGPLPGALALGLYTLGILGRLMAEVVEEMDERPARALAAAGAPGPSVFLYGILPGSLPRFLAYALYRWEVCARETVVVGVVGAGGLGRLLAEQLSSFHYRGVLATLLVFVTLTLVVDILSAVTRRALR